MVQQPRFQEYFMTVLKRSTATWHGVEGLFALATYVSILVLLFFFSGFVGELVNEVAQKTVAIAAVGWLGILLCVVTPFRMWQEERHGRLNIEDELRQKKININWRYSRRADAELIITNVSAKTITGIDVLFSNYRRADGTDIKDVIRSMISVDGKSAPISLNPNVQTYFRFAKIINDPDKDNLAIVLAPSGHDEIKIIDPEVGVKLKISGQDVPGYTINFRLILNDDGSLTIDPWDINKPAVGIDTGQE